MDISIYKSNNECLKHLESIKYANGVYCGKCGTSNGIYKRTNTNIYHCNSCNSDFTVLVGSVFQHTRFPLQKWFAIINIIFDLKKDINSCKIAMLVGASRKVTFYVIKKILNFYIPNEIFTYKEIKYKSNIFVIRKINDNVYINDVIFKDYIENIDADTFIYLTLNLSHK